MLGKEERASASAESFSEHLRLPRRRKDKGISENARLVLEPIVRGVQYRRYWHGVRMDKWTWENEERRSSLINFVDIKLKYHLTAFARHVLALLGKSRSELGIQVHIFMNSYGKRRLL
jgi:hypothetical protein